MTSSGEVLIATMVGLAVGTIGFVLALQFSRAACLSVPPTKQAAVSTEPTVKHVCDPGIWTIGYYDDTPTLTARGCCGRTLATGTQYSVILRDESGSIVWESRRVDRQSFENPVTGYLIIENPTPQNEGR